MTKVEAVHLYIEQEMPAIRRAEERYGFGEENMDSVMRREAWGNFTDSLCKDGQITLRQYENWVTPKFCG